jgi:hypothetical protein
MQRLHHVQHQGIWEMTEPTFLLELRLTWTLLAMQIFHRQEHLTITQPDSRFDEVSRHSEQVFQSQGSGSASRHNQAER